MARDTASSPCRRAGLPAEPCILQMQPDMELILLMIDSQHTFLEHNAMPLVLHTTACTSKFTHTYRYLESNAESLCSTAMHESYLVGGQYSLYTSASYRHNA